MYDHTLQGLQITKLEIKPQIKWAVSLVIADGHFNIPHGFVCVNILTLLPAIVIDEQLMFTKLLWHISRHRSYSHSDINSY